MEKTVIEQLTPEQIVEVVSMADFAKENLTPEQYKLLLAYMKNLLISGMN